MHESILGARKEDLVPFVLLEVDEELHIRTYQERAEFWEQLKVSDVVTLCEAFQYAYLYQKHQNSKDKHMHFQL